MFPAAHPPHTLGPFEILERLGAGGVGEVYLARSRGGKLVAIKTIVDARRGDDASVNTFAHEASVCARLDHPCIVRVHAFLEEPGFAALVYEYVPGVALARVMRLCHRHGVRLPDRAAWHVVERVLAALAYAHRFADGAGQTTPIVHRDVSPSNVLLDWSGGVKIADFGIAKVLGASSPTRVGFVKGTLGCMAPEQARGESVDERADVFAAALLAWRLATGRVPFGKHEKDEFELLRAMRNPHIKPLAAIRPDLPEALLESIACALEPEASRRTITSAQLADVVRIHIDVGAGQVELAALLDRWKAALELTVKRSPEADADGESVAGRIEQTLRYEEVALAFDEEAPHDHPTYHAHALPGDHASLAALPIAAEPRPPMQSSPLPPPAPIDFTPPPPARVPRLPGQRARLQTRVAPAVAVAAFVIVAVVAALVATFAR